MIKNKKVYFELGGILYKFMAELAIAKLGEKAAQSHL